MPEQKSALEAEATVDVITFEHFGREWTVPARRHLSHLRRIRDEARRGWSSLDLILAETFLDEEDFADLVAIDPDEAQLAEFTSEITKLLGFGNSGN